MISSTFGVRRFAAVAAALLSFTSATALQAADRVALVIGVAKYGPQIGTLENSVSDARLIAQTLKDAGFQVDLEVDPTGKQVRDALVRFEADAKKAEAAVVYYAGHGAELNGTNFLVPSDAKLDSPEAFVASSVNTLELRRSVLGARRLRLVILDACRNNPIGEVKGLGRESLSGAPKMVVLMAAAPGQVAQDGDNGHSPFASALAEGIKLTGMIVGQLPGFIQTQVNSRIGEQLPDAQGIFPDLNFMFTPSPGAVAAGSNQTDYRISQEQTDRDFWAAIKDSSDPEDFKLYLQKADKGDIPGSFRSLAMKRMGALGGDPKLSGTRFVDQGDTRVTSGTKLPPPPRVAATPSATAALEAGRDAYGRGDYAGAERAWLPAANAGNGAAMYNLGVLRFYGRGRPRDMKGAADWFAKSAGVGYPSGMLNYALCLLNGYGVAANKTQAVNWLRKAADGGSATAMARMADAYLDGVGVAKSEAQAAQWLQRASDAGDGPAMALLGEFYEQGVGVRADTRRAFTLYSQAALGGQTDAMVRLGYFYEDGAGGVAKDVVQAATWYQRAASQGDGEGAASLGVLYENGNGLPRDYALAAQSYQAAVARKHPRGYLGLGSLYLRGLGVAQNDREALRLFTLAADAGSAAGMKNAGLMYATGRGTAANPATARGYFQKCAAAGDQGCADELARLQ